MSLAKLDLQPSLRNELLELRPLVVEDFDGLFAVGSDPLIWEQHPTRDRYQRERFEVYFRGAIESKGGLLVSDLKSGQIIGSSRYYEYEQEAKSVAIGYTFLARAYWGTTYNRALKISMIDHAFGAVDDVFFHVGENNVRSQKAMERLGAEKVRVIEKQYYGEAKNVNFLYKINVMSWRTRGDSIREGD